jgi:hypothetical protein
MVHYMLPSLGDYANNHLLFDVSGMMDETMVPGCMV